MLPKTTAHTLTDQTLAHVPLSMAEAVKPAIAFADRAGYARFLSAMVAYTRGSGERLEHAARVSPEGPLRAFFSRLAHEEAGHYKLAEADLAAMGLDPDATPNETVLAFHRGWMSQRAPAYFLGTLYALESVAWHLRDDVGPHLARLGLAREMCRFVSVHLRQARS